MLFYPVRFNGRARARAGAARTRASAHGPADPGHHARRRRLAGDHPLARGEDGLDRRRQGDRQARQPGGLLRAARARARSPSTSSPRRRATSASSSSGPWSASTRSCGATCRRACARRVHARVQRQLPEIVARRSPTRSASNIDQLLDVKLMVIRHMEARPELANRDLPRGRAQGAAVHHQLRLLLRVRCSASRLSFLTERAAALVGAADLPGVHRLRHQLARASG